MRFKYHGKYCGPGWSAGEYQDSVVSDLPSVDEFDECCKQHDGAYADGSDRKTADLRFYKCAYRHDKLAAAAVYVQSLFRPAENENMSTKKNLRSRKQNIQPKPTGNDSTRAAPVAIATKRTGKAPKMTAIKDGVRISHRSFLMPVTCQSNFTVNKIACNPGLGGSFPWLSRLARRYEEYKFISLKYSYRSVTSTSSNGVIMMSFDFDAADENPASKSIQAQTIPNSEVNAWLSNDLNVRSTNSFKYVRPGTLASNLDVKTYDLGNLFISSLYGNGTVSGELYVEYTVELRKPTSGSIDSGTLLAYTSNFAVPFPSDVSYFGYAPVVRTSNNVLTFTSSGEWFVTASVVGTGMTAAPAAPTIATSGSGAVSTFYFIIGSGSADRVFKVRAELNDTLTFTNFGAGTTCTEVVIRFAPCDYSLLN